MLFNDGSADRTTPPIVRRDSAASNGLVNARRPALTVSRSLAAGLGGLGVRSALGIGGAAISRFIADCAAVGIHVISTRHESGAAFIACELSLAQHRPVAVFFTTGPGFANALVGLISAAWEGSHIVAVVGGTSAQRLGRGAFQETGAEQLTIEHWLPPGLAHSVQVVDAQRSLQDALSAIAHNRSRSEGSLSVVLLPMHAQLDAADPAAAGLSNRHADALCAVDFDKVCAKLHGRRVAVWVGAGAVGAERSIRQFVEQTGAVVACSPRGKGVFPEAHPQSVNVLGFAARPDARARFAAASADVMLVLGSRLGEFATGWDESLIPEEGLIHVDSNPQSLSRAFPAHPTLPVQTAVRPFMEALVQRNVVTKPISLPLLPRQTAGIPRAPSAAGLIPAETLLASVQRVVVERSEALIMAEAGNAFAWATHCLLLPTPRLRIATQFGAMGHATCGVVGLALGSEKPALALVGDGAMLMWNELTTAQANNAHAIWVVLDDRSLGMVRHGMQALGLPAVATALPPVDFVALANAQGVAARRVDHARQLDDALIWALSEIRPCVVSVRVDPDIAPPFGARNREIRGTDT